MSTWEILLVLGLLQTVYCADTYIRWGKTSCGDTNSVIYVGQAGGAHWSHSGGGSNYLCLPKVPQWGNADSARNGGNTLIYGAEYQLTSSNFPFKEDESRLHDSDVPCAVCLTEKRNTHMMMPAGTKCPDNWDLAYGGYLMTDLYNHHRTEFVCMDEKPEIIGSTANQDGALFYPVEAQCGSLACPPYTSNKELACVVCTK